MLTPEEHEANLAATAAAILDAVRRAFAALLADISAGVPARDAVGRAFASYQGAFEQAFQSALSQEMADFATVPPVGELRVGELSLSDRLYQQSRQTSAAVEQIIRTHTRGLIAARQLALEIYDGYAGPSALRVKAGLPKYIKEAFLQVLPSRPVAVKTEALRAAYSQLLDAIDAQAGLQQALRVAWLERNRYFATRIAYTELHRVWADQYATRLTSDDQLQIVEYRMSGKHPRADICDVWARVDLYGLGPGLYPKSKAPMTPLHPFCMCRLVPRYDVTGAGRYRPAAIRAWLSKLPRGEAAAIAGSRERLARVLDGEPLVSVFNSGKDPLYRFKTVGD